MKQNIKIILNEMYNCITPNYHDLILWGHFINHSISVITKIFIQILITTVNPAMMSYIFYCKFMFIASIT